MPLWPTIGYYRCCVLECVYCLTLSFFTPMPIFDPGIVHYQLQSQKSYHTNNFTSNISIVYCMAVPLHIEGCRNNPNQFTITNFIRGCVKRNNKIPVGSGKLCKECLSIININSYLHTFNMILN